MVLASRRRLSESAATFELIACSSAKRPRSEPSRARSASSASTLVSHPREPHEAMLLIELPARCRLGPDLHCHREPVQERPGRRALAQGEHLGLGGKVVGAVLGEELQRADAPGAAAVDEVTARVHDVLVAELLGLGTLAPVVALVPDRLLTPELVPQPHPGRSRDKTVVSEASWDALLPNAPPPERPWGAAGAFRSDVVASSGAPTWGVSRARSWATDEVA